MVNALWITLIGMGLVFLAILLLWGLMVLLVRLTAEKEAPVEAMEETQVDDSPNAPAPQPDGRDARRRAAAAAVAAALALEQEPAGRIEPARDGASSAWQAIHRAAGLNRQRAGR